MSLLIAQPVPISSRFSADVQWLCSLKTLPHMIRSAQEPHVLTPICLQVLYSLASADAVLQQRTAAALARLVKDADLRLVFIERRGLDILLDPLRDACSKEAQLEAAGDCLPPERLFQCVSVTQQVNRICMSVMLPCSAQGCLQQDYLAGGSRCEAVTTVYQLNSCTYQPWGVLAARSCLRPRRFSKVHYTYV